MECYFFYIHMGNGSRSVLCTTQRNFCLFPRISRCCSVKTAGVPRNISKCAQCTHPSSSEEWWNHQAPSRAERRIRQITELPIEMPGIWNAGNFWPAVSNLVQGSPAHQELYIGNMTPFCLCASGICPLALLEVSLWSAWVRMQIRKGEGEPKTACLACRNRLCSSAAPFAFLDTSFSAGISHLFQQYSLCKSWKDNSWW